FVFDNEKWGHEREVASFAIARAPVTQAEFAAFVDAGGYETRTCWSENGWAWRMRESATHPVYWRRDRDERWKRRGFAEWRDLEPHLPVLHVNWFEAEAFCRFSGRRLPTELEWEVAAAGTPAPGGTLSAKKRRFPWGDEMEPGRAHLDGASAE